MKRGRQVRAALSILLGAGAMYFLVRSLRTAVAGGEVVHWPSATRVLIAFAALALGMWLASTAWVVILGEGSAGNRTDFLTAQLAKYIPGGVWQPLSQVGLSATRSISGRAAGSAVMIYAAAQIVAGLLLVPFLATGQGVSHLVGSVGIVLGSVALIVVPTGARVAERLGRRSRGVWLVASAQARAATSVGVIAMLTFNMAAQGLTFWLLVGEPLGLAALGAYSAAWIGGFLVIPFPAGLGIREAILVALLPVGAGQVIATSLMQRLVAATGEVSLIFLSRSRR